MKKYIVMIIVAICILTGCKNQQNDNVNKNTESEINVIETETENTEQEISAEIIIQSSEDFSEGRAWIKFQIIENEMETNYIGCIDKSGNVVFQYFEEDIIEYTKFEKGSSYIQFTDGTRQIIDKDGVAMCSYTEQELGRFYFSGDGYYYFLRENSGFDTSGIIVTIIDSTGNEVYQGEEGFSAYCGNDMFVTCNFNTGVYKFYNIKEDVYFEIDNIVGVNPLSPKIIFNNGYSVMNLGQSYVLVSVLGEVEEFFGEEQYSGMLCGNIQDGMLIYGWTKAGGLGSYGKQMESLFAYDVVNDTYISMWDTPMEEYIDNIYENFIPKENLCFSNGRVVIQLNKEDYGLSAHN